MMSNTSWAPANETASDIWNEKSILDGLFLGTVAYGIHLTLFISAFHLLYTRKRTQHESFLLVYILVLFILGNIGNGTNIKFGEMTFIDDRNYPGGPNAFFVQQSINPVAVICNSAYIVNSWLQDGLLLYRFWIISQKSLYFIALPALMFLSSVALSLLLIVELSLPGITLWSKISVNLAIPYWSISIALNVVITTFISARLLYMRSRIQREMPSGGKGYVSVTAMLVESAALYTVNGLFFLISYAANSPIQNLTLPLLGQTQSIAPLLIILRVAQGRAWSNDTMSKLSTSPMQFKLSSRIPHGPISHGSSTVLASMDIEDLAAEKERGIPRSVETHVL
jgi:hypothetical protein